MRERESLNWVLQSQLREAIHGLKIATWRITHHHHHRPPSRVLNFFWDFDKFPPFSLRTYTTVHFTTLSLFLFQKSLLSLLLFSSLYIWVLLSCFLSLSVLKSIQRGTEGERKVGFFFCFSFLFLKWVG